MFCSMWRDGGVGWAGKGAGGRWWAGAFPFSRTDHSYSISTVPVTPDRLTYSRIKHLSNIQSNISPTSVQHTVQHPVQHLQKITTSYCVLYILTDFGGPIGELPTAPLLKGKLCFLNREAAVNLLSRWANSIRKQMKIHVSVMLDWMLDWVLD